MLDSPNRWKQNIHGGGGNFLNGGDGNEDYPGKQKRALIYISDLPPRFGKDIMTGALWCVFFCPK